MAMTDTPTQGERYEAFFAYVNESILDDIDAHLDLCSAEHPEDSDDEDCDDPAEWSRLGKMAATLRAVEEVVR